jgi:hypothetical protein
MDSMNVANGGKQHATARLVLFLLIAAGLSGCAVVGGIFKGGVVVGILITVVVVILLFKLFGRR